MQNSKGIYLVFITALISGFSVFLNKFAVSAWSNSSVFATAKNLIVAVFLISFIFLLKKLPELKKLSRKQWFLLALIGLIGGSVSFILFFKGLSLASAANAAFIHKTLFIWVALMAIPFLKEKISSLQFLALGIILAGVYLLKPFGSFHFGYGEFLILLATLLWAVENIVAKIILKDVSSLVVACGRMFFGSLFLLAYLAISGSAGQLFIFSGVKILWLAISGIMLFGYVISWYSALKLAPVTAVSAILVVAAPITLLLDSIFITHRFFGLPIIPIIMIVAGSLIFAGLFSRFKFFYRNKIQYGGRPANVC